MNLRTTVAILSLVAALPALAEPNPDRDAYFGETHIHTSWSVDAWVMGNRITGPNEAFKYAQGQPIKHPFGFDIKIETPMDFMGVTDHSEYVGITKQANTPGSYVSKLPEAQPMIMKDPNSKEEQNRVFSYLLKLNSGAPVKAFMRPEDHRHGVGGSLQDRRRKQSARQVHGLPLLRVDLDARQRNLHRNIFFRGDKVPESPFSALDSRIPRSSGSGWTPSARRALNCSPSRTTPM